MADDYVRMACRRGEDMKVRRVIPTSAAASASWWSAAGFSGLTEAREASKAGYEVMLVEKTEALGDLVAMRFETHSLSL